MESVVLSEPPPNMRAFSIAVFLLLALVSDGADACKPRLWSAREIVGSSSTIFIAKITAMHADHGEQVLALTVQETLKGALPLSIRTNARNVGAFGDGCNALAGHQPVRNVGETWVVSGHFEKATSSFQAIGETCFRVPDSYRTHVPDPLRTLREELKKAAK